MIVPGVAQMIAQDQSGTTPEHTVDEPPSRTPDLPFRIELWDEDNQATEQVVARVRGAKLAEAIFKAACEQYPGRLLTLCRGPDRLASTED
jgi:hypothetical protein